MPAIMPRGGKQARIAVATKDIRHPPVILMAILRRILVS